MKLLYRFGRWLPLLGCAYLAVGGRLVAQPAPPTPEQVAWLRSLETAANGRHANLVTPAPVPLSVTLTSRAQSRAFYNAIYSASDNVPIDWTASLTGSPGSSATGTPGTTSSAFQAAVQLRINWFRAMGGIPAAIAMNDSADTYNVGDQQAALMMTANNALSHMPPSNWLLYTSAGATAAANSNLALGNFGPDAITGYINDFGSNNAEAGHRRWILYPQTQTMGTGDIPETNGFTNANATWVLDGNYGTTRPATRDNFVAWPPPGYVPYPVIFARWSFGYPDADFSSATVTMTSNGSSVPIKLEAPAVGTGEPTLVWDFDNMDTTAGLSLPQPAADVTYNVQVNGVQIGGQPQNFSYSVTAFDPAAAGPGDNPPTVSGPGQAVVGQASTFSVAGVPPFASGFQYRSVTVAPATAIYGAEGGLQGMIANLSNGYSAVDASEAASGSASYHLAMPDPNDQTLTLPGEYTFSSGSASLQFASRLGYATVAQAARVQISLDDGNSWNDIYTQVGSGNDAGEFSFTERTISLNSYVGLTFEIRFAYTYTSAAGPFYNQTTSGIGWNIDSISFTGVNSATVGAPSAVATGSTFAYTPAAAGSLALQARGVMFGAYPIGWGPLTSVSAFGGTSRLIDVSARADVGTGANILIVGFVIGGTGSEQTLIRGVGPTLASFGVTGVLSNPQLSVFNAGASTALYTNTGWGGSSALSQAFTQVGAQPLPAGSADSALLEPLNAGGYTAEVAGVNNGTGVALAEAYDADTSASASARFINLSARASIGTGGNILIAGFVVGGSGTETVLLRGVGPTLGAIGVSGALAAPVLTLLDVSGNVIATNSAWNIAPVVGNSPVNAVVSTATAATMVQVGAFTLTQGSLDAAMLVTLPVGGYTVEVSGANSTTGVGLAEIYEVP